MMSRTGLFPPSRGDVQWHVASLGAAITALALAACSGRSGGSALPTVARSPGQNVPSAPSRAPGTPVTASSGTADAIAEAIGTVVRFSARSTSVDLTIDEDNRTYDASIDEVQQLEGHDVIVEVVAP